MPTTADAGLGSPEVVAMTTTSVQGDAAPEVVAMTTLSAPILPGWVTPHGDAYRGEREVRGRRFAYALWDSRRVALTLVPGQIDPGGSGKVDGATWNALIAAFNGGFRSVHGHYGLRAEGTTFLPARAGLATLARGSGGWILGTLPEGVSVDDAEMFRQNLPPLFAGGMFDPTRRVTFGALAPGKTGARTTRSALGLRDDGVFVYAYGIDVTPEELALAAREAGAAYTMALDINDGQAGFEWLSVGAHAGPLPATITARGPSHDAARATWDGSARGRRVHAERLSVPMGTPLPRWLNGDSRDYFVLSRPPAPLPPAQIAEGLEAWMSVTRKEK